MYCLIALLCACAINSINCQELRKDILEYFNSDNLVHLRHEWDNYRQALEQAIATSMQEIAGKNAMNVFIKQIPGLKLTTGYHHCHGTVHILFNNMYLDALPQFLLPDVSFSLSSNVLKLETRLSRMIIHAGYSLMRNKSRIIDGRINYQDPFVFSPFLFSQVKDSGHVALSVEGCILSGYVITRLSGSSVNLRHHRFTLSKCSYFLEIYQPGLGTPPVLAKFSEKKAPGYHIEIKHLLLQRLQSEILPKLQSVLFSMINTTAIYQRNLYDLTDAQDLIFRETSSNITKVIRDLNRKIVKYTKGATQLCDFYLTWDDTASPMPGFSLNNASYNIMRLTDLVVTGLDTLYNAYNGGPYKLDNVMIGEQLRFSSLQVRGYLYYEDIEKYEIAVEISDLAIDIDIEILPAAERNKIKTSVVGFRKIAFIDPLLVIEPAEAMITGYLLDELPDVIAKLIKIDIAANKSDTIEYLTDVDAAAIACIGARRMALSDENEESYGN